MGSYQVVDRCDFQAGNVINNQYTVRKTLGEGSFGVVYLVEDRRGSKYALKLLRLWEVPADIRQPLMERFEMEFKTGQIDCDNLVRSLDFGTVGGNPFIVMEFCPGGDLEPLLGKSEAQAPRICQDILIGLNALHTQGKVHRDLKPENVLFKQNGKAALTDFGIAGDRTHRMTQRNIFGKPNQIFGTYAYMPPEQVTRARGGATVLPTTDIFSFGVLAYQLLTGVLPFGQLESHMDLAEYQKRGKDGYWSRDRLCNLHNSHPQSLRHFRLTHIKRIHRYIMNGILVVTRVKTIAAHLERATFYEFHHERHAFHFENKITRDYIFGHVQSFALSRVKLTFFEFN